MIWIWATYVYMLYYRVIILVYGAKQLVSRDKNSKPDDL